jgi:hypothetical protein
MKKVLFILATSALLVSCGPSDDAKEECGNKHSVRNAKTEAAAKYVFDACVVEYERSVKEWNEKNK